MKIALIQCPSWGTYIPPLGISYLSSYLKSKGYEVNQYDLNIELFDSIKPRYKRYWKCGVLDFDKIWTNKWLLFRKIPVINFLLMKRWAKKILKEKPKVVCFSVVFTSQLVSLMLAREIKKISKDTIIVFGGFNCNFPTEAKKALDSYYVDVLVKGEGEIILADLISKIQKGNLEKIEKCQGAIIRKGNKFIDCGERTLIKNLDELPFPDFSDLPMEKYTNKYMLPILMSRGCINKCVFCIEHKFAKYFRSRSAENVLEEIKMRLQDYSERKYFNFNDSLINGNIRELEKLCDLLIEEDLGIEWEGNATITKSLNLNLLKKMKKSGCTRLIYGVESASQKVLDSMGKRFKVEEARKVIRDTHKSGIKPITNWIIGFPTETETDFNKTLNFIKENSKYMYVGPPWGSSCVLMPYNDMWLNFDSYSIDKENIYSGWRTKSMKNTPDVRKRRLNKFKNLVSSLGICFES